MSIIALFIAIFMLAGFLLYMLDPHFENSTDKFTAERRTDFQPVIDAYRNLPRIPTMRELIDENRAEAESKRQAVLYWMRKHYLDDQIAGTPEDYDDALRAALGESDSAE